MNNHNRTAVFCLETLGLVLVMALVILILTRVFGAAALMNRRADRLTEAAQMAENAAELLMAGGDVERDMPENQSDLRLETTEASSEEYPGLAVYSVTVYDNTTGEAVFTLETSVLREAAG